VITRMKKRRLQGKDYEKRGGRTGKEDGKKKKIER
jgi:hypothetical protein